MVPALLLVALAPSAFMLSTPTSRSSPRAASASRLLEKKRNTLCLLASPQKPLNLAKQLNIAPLPIPASEWLMHMRRMLLGLLGWSAACSSGAEDVMLALAAPETYRLLLEWRRHAFGGEARIQHKLQHARGLILRVSDPELVESVSVRSKGLWSTFHKACMRGRGIHDVLAVRLVVQGSEHDCFEALQEVRKLWPSVGGRVKDYISSPKPNGYRAVHDTLLLPCGTQMEVQVRTCEMHAHAEEGLAAHRQYKGPAHTLPRKLLRDIASIAMPQRPAFASPLELAI